jgi:murein L,D-transpeptidase YcbB/YkuD
MDFLKDIFGEKSLTYAELETALKENKDIKLANLAAGGYVAKEKFDAKETELKNINTQLTEANKQIEEFRGMDIDGIKTAVTEWKEKAEKAEADNARQQKEFSAREYLSGFAFASEMAKKAAISDFMAQDFQHKDGKFVGADEYMEKLKETDPGAFASNPNDPKFTKGGSGNGNLPQITKDQLKTMSYGDRLKLKTEQPEVYKSLTE